MGLCHYQIFYRVCHPCRKRLQKRTGIQAISKLIHGVGSRQKTDKYGQPYGWPANVYDKVENWVPEEWLKLNLGLSVEAARERILDKGIAIGKDINRTELVKMLGMLLQKIDYIGGSSTYGNQLLDIYL